MNRNVHDHPDPPRAMGGVAEALAAAALFGLASPLAKIVMGRSSPLIMAGLLYLGAGIGLAAWRQLRRAANGAGRKEAALRREDLPWMAGAVLAGGVAAPALQMIGLAATPASTASLLLNLEAALTVALAWLVFRESVDVRVASATALIVLGGVVLTGSGPATGLPWASLAIIGACAAWALDNNLTRRIATSDPVQIAAIKGLGAGSVNIGLGLAHGGLPPGPVQAGAAALVGFAGYGVSLVLFVLALRRLGSARTAAYFSLAPFVGVVASFALLRERLTPGFALAAVLMGVGVFVLMSERHGHEHVHDAIEHEHRHVHDIHHRHAHEPGDPAGEPHAHPHRHEPMIHAHPHYPDAHHRHRHTPRGEGGS